MENPKIKEQIKLMMSTDRNGIFIFPLPYAKPDTKASVETAAAIIAAPIIPVTIFVLQTDFNLLY
jgi:hypothetical protein